MEVSTSVVDKYPIALIQNFVIDKPLNSICTIGIFKKTSEVEVFIGIQSIRANSVYATNSMVDCG